MNEKIVSLIRLQEFDTRLEALAQGKVQRGLERERWRGEIQGLQTAFEDSKKALTQAQVDKKNLEMDIETKEQAMRKSSGELNTVRSNEAYKVLLTQIEDAKKAKVQMEDRVLELMDDIERYQRELKEREKKIQEERGAVEQKIRNSEEEEKKLDEEAARERAERDGFHAGLPESVRLAYDNVRTGPKKGPVVVPLKGQICGGCRMILPPSVVNEVLKGQELVACETCTRILFIPSAPVAPEGASSI